MKPMKGNNPNDSYICEISYYIFITRTSKISRIHQTAIPIHKLLTPLKLGYTLHKI